jgi:hypothetical protein
MRLQRLTISDNGVSSLSENQHLRIHGTLPTD